MALLHQPGRKRSTRTSERCFVLKAIFPMALTKSVCPYWVSCKTHSSSELCSWNNVLLAPERLCLSASFFLPLAPLPEDSVKPVRTCDLHTKLELFGKGSQSPLTGRPQRHAEGSGRLISPFLAGIGMPKSLHLQCVSLSGSFSQVTPGEIFISGGCARELSAGAVLGSYLPRHIACAGILFFRAVTWLCNPTCVSLCPLRSRCQGRDE